MLTQEQEINRYIKLPLTLLVEIFQGGWAVTVASVVVEGLTLGGFLVGRLGTKGGFLVVEDGVSMIFHGGLEVVPGGICVGCLWSGFDVSMVK